MYLSNTYNSPIIYNNPLHRSFANVTDNTKLEDPQNSFNFPSPFYADDGLFYLPDLFHQQIPPLLSDEITADERASSMLQQQDSARDAVQRIFPSNIKNGEPKNNIPKNRSSKKDRHSKINTAHGPRDRRMRLSLDVARKFFDLQDMLGFDKASKTVEWLLTNSRSAIKELARGLGQLPKIRLMGGNNNGANSSSSTSECEVVSGIDESAATDHNKGKAKPSSANEKNKMRIARRAAFQPIARESRKKARERARARTKEKRRLMNHHHDHLNHFENGEEESGTQSLQAEVEELSSNNDQPNNIGDSNLVVTGNWSPCTIFNYQQNAGISHEHSFTDFQFCGKLWEA